MPKKHDTSCDSCGAPITQTPGPGRPRLYCDAYCRNKAVTARHAREVEQLALRVLAALRARGEMPSAD